MTIAKVSEDTLKLREFVKVQPDGERLGYERVQFEAGVIMNAAGKAKLRGAVTYLGRIYTTEAGEAIILGNSGNALGILFTRSRRVASAADRAMKTLEVVERRHLEGMSADERSQVALFHGVCSSVKMVVDQVKVLYEKDHTPVPQSVTVPIPELRMVSSAGSAAER